MVRRTIKKDSSKKCNKRSKQRRKSMPQEPEDGDRFYVIEELLEKRTTPLGQEEYLVRWKNYPPIWDSWEPREELEKNAADMIHEFNRIQDKSDTSNQLHCICRKAYRFHQGGMIQCYNCHTWFHFDCLNMNMEQANLYKAFYCKGCRLADPSLKSSFKQERLATSFYAKTLAKEL